MSETDLQLLMRYARQKGEDAFAELVRRHLNLVFSAALRQVRFPQLAEEVAQSVFTDLARQAERLAPGTVLTAWLYEVTRRTAIDVVRREASRQLREQVSVELNAMNATATDWTEVEPLLDEAMHALDDTDRTAVLLRYFENKSFREVGQMLDTTEDAARKRLSRAVERLREFFAKRGVTIGASGLVVAISTNAVQAAPAGLAATISTAVLTGASIATTTATAAKTIAMTALQKTLVTVTVAVLAGAGIYEARQAANARAEVQTLQEQQTPLTEQIQQLQRERDELAKKLDALRDDNEQLNRNTAELLKLRGEVGRLRNEARASQKANTVQTSTDAGAERWLARINHLKRYVEQNPSERIPEFQFVTDQDWFTAGDARLETADSAKQDDYRRALQSLRFQAERGFGKLVQTALSKYSSANNGQFPSQLSELVPFCEPKAMEMLLQLYAIRPADMLPENVLEDVGHVKADRFITRKNRVNPDSTSRYAIFTDTSAYWQSPP